MEAGNYGASRRAAPSGFARRLSTETKHAFKTTEFWVYVAFLLAVLIAGTVDDAEGSAFGADDVWLFATIVTGAYLISRGLAKSGSRDPYWDSPDAGSDESIGDRVKAAAQVLTEGQGGQQADGTTETTHMPGRPGGPAA
jgi:hypothetical protein